MNHRFDLPPEVMPGPRLPRASETQVKAPPAPKQVAPGVFKGTDGKLFTVLAFPPAHSKDAAMLHADFDGYQRECGPENEEDDPVDPSTASCHWASPPDIAPWKIWQADPVAVMYKDYTAGAFHESDVMQETQAMREVRQAQDMRYRALMLAKLQEQRAAAVQEDTRRQTEAYRAEIGPRFRVTRHGISALLPIRDLTHVEMTGNSNISSQMYSDECTRRGIALF